MSLCLPKFRPLDRAPGWALARGSARYDTRSPDKTRPKIIPLTDGNSRGVRLGRLWRAGSRPQALAPAAATVGAQRGETPEVNLIGMRAPDALRRLEEFLDQAYLTNQSEVRVIHGVSSGAVREYLSTSPYCTGFHEAEPQSGGADATIVQIGL